MKKISNNIFIKIICLLLVFNLILLTGCNKQEKVNKDSKIANVKNQMINNLDNYSYKVKIITKTGFVDVETNMDCREDLKNKLSYCHTSTIGVDTYEYTDYKNKASYSKVDTLYGSEGWKKSKISVDNKNSWINLSDNIFDLQEESVDGGTIYKGTISSKKLASIMQQVDTKINVNKIISKDINIEVFVNSSNYIETMNFTLEVLGIEEIVEIQYVDYNTSGDIELPKEFNNL